MTVTKSKAEKTREVLSFLPRVDRHKPKGGEIKKSKISRWRAGVLVAVHVAIGIHIWHWLATGETMTPVEPSEAMETVELGRINAGFVLFLSLIASTLIFGRWFCGWACHVVALQDLSAWLLQKAGLRPRPVRSRLLIYAPWVVGGYMFVWPLVLHFIAPDEKPLPGISEWQWQLTTEELWRTFPGPIMAIATAVVVGFLIVWWMGAKGFCTYGCPYGAFFTLADRVAPMSIVVSDACEHCGHCTASCTSNVRVHEEVAKYGQVVDPGCMKCMDCVSVCPTDALSYGFAKPKPLTPSQQRITARADFAWWEEVLLAVTAIGMVQFAFRGAWFGEPIPLLLAVALGVITAVMLLLLVRLCIKQDVTFQHTTLRDAGKRSKVGSLVMILLIGWMLFSAHTMVGQLKRGPAIESGKGPIYSAFYTRDRDVPGAQRALEQVEDAAAWQLVLDPQLREVRALLCGAVGRHKDAEVELTGMFQRDNGLFYAESKMALANYFGIQGSRFEEAEQLLLEVVSSNPTNTVAPRLLQAVRTKKGM